MPPSRIDQGPKTSGKIREDSAAYSRERSSPTPEELLAGSDAAMRRAAEKAVAQARAAGLEPVMIEEPETKRSQPSDL